MSRATLLLIEDELERLSDSAALLRREGHQVLVTDDPAEGVRQAREEHPDAILLDLDMPGFDGWRVMELLRKDARTEALPVIALTRDHVDLARLREAGFCACLREPLNPRAVADTLVRCTRA